MMTMTERGASPEAIRRHYDVANEFYELWLDPTLCYSCALWEEDEPDSMLELAQLRKLDFHARQIQAKNAARVLDVGCGWGSLVRRLVETHGVRHATGLTLSDAQAQWCVQHPDPRVEIRIENWLDHRPAAPYDGIISIGAFEHFAKAEWPEAQRIAAYRAFFAHCRDWLKPGGRLSLQTIAWGNVDVAHVKNQADTKFMFDEIFPESVLPTLADIIAASDGLLEVINLRNDREHYTRTCQVWYQRLVARKAD
ncbi:MAG TPA: class I SAM-dependent methyltransferase, partial [Planctomycetaceae bacterium]|nr:class I SAM-dependent methyltransferase [Planctomycetaceae bacterium]